MKKQLLLLFGMVACWITGYGQLTAPFTESFNSSAIPAGWVNSNNLSSTTAAALWKFSGSMGYDATSVTNHSGSVGHFAWADGSSPVPSRVELTTDSINMSALTNPMVRFYLFSNNVTYPASGNNTIFIDFYDGSNWNDSIWGYSGNNPSWQEIDVLLNSYTITGKCLIRFVVDQTQATGFAYHNDIAIDDITVDNVPTCPKPTALSSSASNANSITLNWVTGGATSWEVEYGPVGHAPGTGTIVSATTSSNFVLGSLTSATIYDIYVRDYCSATDQSFWRGPITDTTTCVSALSGTYTINQYAASSATNFTSFSELAEALTFCGVTAPVTVNVTTGSGMYEEQVEFYNIPGASSTNTVTINGNGEMLVDSGNVGGNNAAILLNGVSYLTIDSLNIVNTESSNSVGVQFMNSADSNIIRNCSIEVPFASVSSVIPVTFSGSATSSTTSGVNGNYNLLEGNTLSGGYYGIRHYGGGTSSRIVGNQFINNTVQDFYYYGIYNYYTEETKVIGNDIHRLNRAGVGNFYAIYNYYTTENVEITNNWIHDGFAQATGSTSTVYAIYSSASDNSTGNESVVANNLITNVNNGGTHYLIYNSGSDGWSYYHNTLVENDPNAAGTGNTRMFYQTSTASDINFKNNLLYLDRGTSGAQYLLYLNSTSSGYDIDNNAYYMPAAGTTHDFGYYSGDQADFAAWQSVNSSAFDQSSAQGDPFFANPSTGDFAPSAAYFNNIGLNLQSIVGTDILGATRSVTPDPGAYEFTPPPGPDMSVSNIYTTGASCGATTDIIVEVLNQGTDTVTSFTLNYTISGVVQTPIALTGVYATGDVDSVTITGIPISSAALTNVVVTISGVAPGTDTDPANNTGSIDLRSGLSGTYTVNQAAAPSNTNFASFNGLATALMNYGVCGDVIVNVAGTGNTYTEQVWLNEIPGASSTATVVINGNGNNLQFLSSSSGERATITLNGTDWLTIDSLNVTALGSTGDYGFGITLTNNADHNTIRNCVITVADDQTSSNFAGLAISGSLTSASSYGQSGNYNLVEGNVIHGGYYGLTCQGESSDSTNGNIIRNNIIEDFHYSGAYMYYSRDLEFTGNDISRIGRTTTSSLYALRAYYGKSAKFVGNRIHDGFASNPSSTSISYYLYIYYMEGTTTNPTLIANNLVYNTESEGTVNGGYFGSLSNTIVAHNSIILEDDTYSGTSSPYCRGFYFTSTMIDVNFSNNLVYFDVNVPGTSNSYMVYANTAPTVMDNNAYYIGTNGPGNFGYSSGAKNTFSDWKSATGGDANSVLVNPYLTSLINDDFTPQSTVLDGMGADLTAFIPSDINGVARGAATDPGAIEFTGAPCTGLAGITDTATANSATVMWNGPGQMADIIWGPVGFMQASITPDTVSVSAMDTNGTILGLSSNTCYEYYIQLNCTSSIPGAPPVMGPYVVCTDCANGPLTGTYTVGGAVGPNNFATLDSVIDALQGCGIGGPVVFNLQGGTHNGFTLGAVHGSSAINTITFNGAANFADTIVSSTGTTVELTGASYVNFNNLHIANTSSFVVHMNSNAHHLSFDNCELLGSETTTASGNSLFVASGSTTSPTSSGNNAQHVSLTNSTLKGGYYGVSFYGTSSTTKSTGLELSNNTFVDQYYTGARVYYTDSVDIKGNSISGLRSTSSYGLYLYYSNNVEALSNEVYDAGTYGMYLYYSNYLYATPGSHTTVANNMLQSNGTAGLYVYYPVSVDVFHNSIQGGTSYGMYLSGSSTVNQDVDVRNNIIENAGTGTAFNVGTAPANTNIDYNLYYSGGNIGSGHVDLAAWLAADTMWNQNSAEGMISNFVSNTDLHTVGTAANDIGDNSVGITVDIDGDQRPASGSTVVDMGADEYTPLSFDVSVDAVVNPLNGSCGDSNTSVSVVFTNIGLQGASNVGLTVNITGANTATMTGTYSGTLTSLESDTITVSSFNTVMGGVFNIEAILNYSGDQDASNDTLRTSVNINDALARTPIAKYDSVCAGQYDTLYWPANSADLLLQWESSTGDSLSVNDTLVVGPMGVNDTTFVLAARPLPSGNVGAVDNSIGSYGNVWNSTYGLIFDVYASTVLHSVDVYPTGPGVIEFILEDANGNMIDTRLVQITGGSQTSPFKAVLNFNLTPGTDYVLRPGTTNSTTSSVRNNTGGNYPYTLPGVLSITGNLFDNGAGPYYYYFYNWQIGGGCSRPDGSVTLYNSAGALSAAFTENLQNATDSNMVVDFDASASSGASSYSWDFGDGNTGNGMITSHTYASNGTYNVTLVVTGPCGTDTISKTVTIAGISLEENALSRTMEVYPNPAQDVVNVRFETLNQDAVVRITDVAGKEVIRLEEGNINKYFSKAIDISNLSKGIYLLEVSDDNHSAVKRLIKD